MKYITNISTPEILLILEISALLNTAGWPLPWPQMKQAHEDKLSEIERELWTTKSEIASLAFLIKGLHTSEGGDEWFGVGLLLERHWKTLDRIEELVLEILKKDN